MGGKNYLLNIENSAGLFLGGIGRFTCSDVFKVQQDRCKYSRIHHALATELSSFIAAEERFLNCVDWHLLDSEIFVPEARDSSRHYDEI